MESYGAVRLSFFSSTLRELFFSDAFLISPYWEYYIFLNGGTMNGIGYHVSSFETSQMFNFYINRKIIKNYIYYNINYTLLIE